MPTHPVEKKTFLPDALFWGGITFIVLGYVYTLGDGLHRDLGIGVSIAGLLSFVAGGAGIAIRAINTDEIPD